MPRRAPASSVSVGFHRNKSFFLLVLPAFVYPETKDDLEQLTTEIKKRANNVRNKLKSKKGTWGTGWPLPPRLTAVGSSSSAPRLISIDAAPLVPSLLVVWALSPEWHSIAPKILPVLNRDCSRNHAELTLGDGR